MNNIYRVYGNCQGEGWRLGPFSRTPLDVATRRLDTYTPDDRGTKPEEDSVQANQVNLSGSGSVTLE